VAVVALYSFFFGALKAAAFFSPLDVAADALYWSKVLRNRPFPFSFLSEGAGVLFPVISPRSVSDAPVPLDRRRFSWFFLVAAMV